MEDGAGGGDDPFGGVLHGSWVAAGPVGDVAEAVGGGGELGGVAEDVYMDRSGSSRRCEEMTPRSRNASFIWLRRDCISWLDVRHGQ